MFKTGDKVVRVLPYSNPAEYDEGFMREGSEYIVELGGDFVVSLCGSDFPYRAAAFELVKPTFSNMKFRVPSPEHSKEIQEALFEMGYKWFKGGKDVLYTNYNFLYTWDSGFITYGDVERNFKDKIETKEYTLLTTKSYKIIPKPEVITIDGKTYDKEAVLKRLAELEEV